MKSQVEHIDRKLNRLRQHAHKFKVNGANINWNYIASSSSVEHQPRNTWANWFRSIECKTDRFGEPTGETLQFPCAEFLWHAPGGESVYSSECKSQAVLQGSYQRHRKQLPRLWARRSLCLWVLQSLWKSWDTRMLTWGIRYFQLPSYQSWKVRKYWQGDKV